MSVLCLVCSCSDDETVNEQDNDSLAKTYIPDDVFEQYLITYSNPIDGQAIDDVMDNYVLTSRISNLTNLDLSNQSWSNVNDYVYDLTGIEDFVSLEHLDVSFNQISQSFDLSELENLETLNVTANLLDDLDVSANNKLKFLHINNNNISSINLNENNMLIEFTAFNNNLSSIDLSNNSNLTLLSINSNNLTSVQLNNNPNLVEIIFTKQPNI